MVADTAKEGTDGLPSETNDNAVCRHLGKHELRAFMAGVILFDRIAGSLNHTSMVQARKKKATKKNR